MDPQHNRPCPVCGGPLRLLWLRGALAGRDCWRCMRREVSLDLAPEDAARFERKPRFVGARLWALDGSEAVYHTRERCPAMRRRSRYAPRALRGFVEAPAFWHGDRVRCADFRVAVGGAVVGRLCTYCAAAWRRETTRRR